MSLRVLVVAPSLSSAKYISGLSERAGHLVTHNWERYDAPMSSVYRENRLALLSSQEAAELAEDLMTVLTHVDVLVSVQAREAQTGRVANTSFYVGAAIARGVPVVVIGGFDDPALYHPRIMTCDPEDISVVLIRIGESHDPVTRKDVDSHRSDSANSNSGGSSGDGGGV